MVSEQTELIIIKVYYQPGRSGSVEQSEQPGTLGPLTLRIRDFGIDTLEDRELLGQDFMWTLGTETLGRPEGLMTFLKPETLVDFGGLWKPEFWGNIR